MTLYCRNRTALIGVLLLFTLKLYGQTTSIGSYYFPHHFNAFLVPEKRLRVSALGELIYGVTPNLQVETQAFGLALSIPNLSIKHKMFDDPYFERTYSLGAGYARNGKHNLSDLINRISQGDLFYAYLLSSKISSNTFTTSLGSYFIYWHTEGPTDLQSTLQRGLLGILSFDWNLTNSLLLHGLAVVPYFGRTKNENETISLSNQSFVKGAKRTRFTWVLL